MGKGFNLPNHIEFDGAGKRIYYIYNALGEKIKKIISKGAPTYTNVVTEYLNGFHYEGGDLKFFPTAEGYVNVTEGLMTIGGGRSKSYSYVYNYTDHLGNVRLSYTRQTSRGQPIPIATVLEENHYYPFGLKHKKYGSTVKDFVVIDEETEEGYYVGIDILPPQARKTYQYKYNGKELQDELGLNMYDYGWRNYMPDVGRWTQIDPLFNDLKFAHDNEDVDPDDHEEVYMAIINDLEIGGGIYNTDNLNPYGYGYNNPVSFDDPDGRCPACWGALIGAGVDIALQMTSNAVQGKDLTDINWKQVGVSAVAGAISGGISSISKIKNASALVKVGVEVATDIGVSVGSQVVNDGKVTLKKTIIDVTAEQVVGRGVGKVAEKRALNSAKGKQLQASVNKQKNIARGKSNITPKSKADVKGAEKKFDRYVNTRATASSATASGAASTTAENASKKKKETNQN
jgi:RHS repeat-associated protein